MTPNFYFRKLMSIKLSNISEKIKKIDRVVFDIEIGPASPLKLVLV